MHCRGRLDTDTQARALSSAARSLYLLRSQNFIQPPSSAERRGVVIRGRVADCFNQGVANWSATQVHTDNLYK